MHNAVKQKAGLVLVEALKERLDKLTEQVSGGKGHRGGDSGSEYEDGSDDEAKSNDSAIHEEDEDDSDNGSPNKQKKDMRVKND